MPGNAAIDYIKGCREELRKVTWPSREKIIRDTLVVILLSAGIAALIGAADFVLTKVFQRVVGV